MGFATDIKPMFRDKDHSAMAFAFDLWDYDDVKENADGILGMVRGGDMPCDEPWTEDQVSLFEAWMTDGFQP